MPGSADDRCVPRRDVPGGAALFQREMRDRHAFGPVPGLREEDAVDRRVRDLTVAVAQDDQVDAGDVSRDLRHRVLAVGVGRVHVRSGRDPRVGHDDDRFRAGGAGGRDGPSDRRPHRADRHMRRGEIGGRPADRSGRRGADDADLHARALDDGERPPRGGASPPVALAARSGNAADASARRSAGTP